MGKPIKVLFVVMDFWQAGAERFAYEIDMALNKASFETHILSVRDLNTSEHFTDYYYSRHLALKSVLYFLKDLDKDFTDVERVFRKIKRITNRKKIPNHPLNKFFDQFDVISWMGEYTFIQLGRYLSESAHGSSIIHLMNAKFQGVSIFNHFPKDRHYTFTSGYNEPQQVSFELSDFSEYKHVLFPLSLKIDPAFYKWRFATKEVKRIGIFTRLDSMKPLDPFLYAYHLLLDIMPDVELHIFGSGDPVKTGVRRFAEHLGIEQKVHFRGHQENIIDVATKELLDLVWFQGYINRPAGYAGFDICMTGIPQVFWEFTPAQSDKSYENTVYPIYKNLNRFVAKSCSVLGNSDTAEEVSLLQYNQVLQDHDSEKNIKILENLYVELSNRRLQVLQS